MSHRDKNYLKFIQSQPCVVTGVEGNQVVAHHVRMGNRGGIGIKPSDYFCLPMSATQHMTLHNQGEKSYWKENKIDPDASILSHLLLYLDIVARSNQRLAQEALGEALWLLKINGQKIGY